VCMAGFEFGAVVSTGGTRLHVTDSLVMEARPEISYAA
jgi:hypothetical protein